MSTAPPLIGFGDFQEFCKMSSLPICDFVRIRLLQVEESRAATVCSTQYFFTTGFVVNNIPDLAATVLVLFGTFALYYLTLRKKTGVGRRELALFYSFYVLTLILQILSSYSLLLFALPVAIAFLKLAYVGMIVATTCVLYLNAFVGFQIITDGTPLSLSLIGGTGVIVGAAASFFTWYTTLTSTSPLYMSATGNSAALWILHIILPLAFVIGFFVVSMYLVIRLLGETRPKVFLGASLFFWLVAQGFTFVVNHLLCNAASNQIDGAFASTLFTFIAVFFVYKYWDSITEDESEAQLTTGKMMEVIQAPPATGTQGYLGGGNNGTLPLRTGTVTSPMSPGLNSSAPLVNGSNYGFPSPVNPGFEQPQVEQAYAIQQQYEPGPYEQAPYEQNEEDPLSPRLFN